MAPQPKTRRPAPARPPANDPDHARPLDAVLQALADAECGTCLAVLAMLRRHLEATIPAWHPAEVR